MDLQWLVSGLLSTISILLFYLLKRFGDRLDSLEKEMVTFKLNYMSRFELATADRVELKAVLLKAINDIIINNEKTHNAIILEIRSNKP